MEKKWKPVPDVEALRYKGTPEKPDIKIFVSHRIDLDSETIDNPLYIPVRCGAVYDEREDITMLGDDTGDNISEKRMSYCELTVQYWAWKNIKADYYGLCHYRRYLSFSPSNFPGNVDYHDQVLEANLNNASAEKYGLLDSTHMMDEIGKYDIIIPQKWNVTQFNGPSRKSKSVYDMWKDHENILIGKNSLDITIEIIKELFPQYSESCKAYLSQKYVTGFNCFIMRKALFQQLCEFEFSVLKELEQRLDSTYYGRELTRTLGFIGETLVGIFVYHCEKQYSSRILQQQLIMFQNTEHYAKIKPIWANEIPIVVTSSDFYVPYVGVFIQSIAETCNPAKYYDVIVLNKSITPQNKEFLLRGCRRFKNIAVQFYNPTNDLNGMKFYTANAVEESNYRLLAPWILTNHQKAIIMDVDIILKEDISHLYDETIFAEDELIAAAKDMVYQGMLNGVVEDAMEYATKTMKMRQPYDYVNTGVMVFDLQKIRNQVEMSNLLDFANTHHFRIQEQDLINVYYEGKIKFLDVRWNFYTETNSWITHCINCAPLKDGQAYFNAAKAPALIHYANVPKAWDDPTSLLADEFWMVARRTIFYEVILSRLINVQTGVLHGAVYELQQFVYHKKGSFPSTLDTRSGARRFADKLLPKGSKRREFAKIILPKGSLRWRFCKQIYYIFAPQYKTQNKK